MLTGMIHQSPRFAGKEGFLFSLVLILGILLSGCSRLNVYRIKYNPDKKVYEYPLPGMPPATLRTNSGELVTEENFEQFIAELSHMDFKYPFDDRLELASVPKESDFRLASVYAESVKYIKQEAYSQAYGSLEQLQAVYPRALLYSDLAFLKGYVEEKQGNVEAAKENYRNYLSFSSQKYSERFRDHRYADNKDNGWLKQRAYASEFIADRSPLADSEFLSEITPRYYFTNLQPGFTLSNEGLTEHSRGIFSLSLGTDLSSNLSAGFQYYRLVVWISIQSFQYPGICGK